MTQRVRRDRRQWKKIIAEQAVSGLSARSFCQQESVGLVSFYQWRQRLSDEGTGSLTDDQTQKSPSFIDVGPLEGGGGERPTGGSGFSLTLDLGEGLKLTLERG